MQAIEKLSSLHRGGDTLRVFVYPPREDKVCRLLARGSSDSADRERVDFIKKYFQCRMVDHAIYPLDDKPQKAMNTSCT